MTTDRLPIPIVSNAAKRAADAINGYVTFMDRDELRRKWIAIRLADGSHDGTLYDSRRDAIRHQSDEFLCAYVSFRNLQQGTSSREMEVFLRFNRDAYDAGFRMPDPDSQTGGPEVLVTTQQMDYYRNQIGREFFDRNREFWQQMIRGSN